MALTLYRSCLGNTPLKSLKDVYKNVTFAIEFFFMMIAAFKSIFPHSGSK